MRIEVQHDLPLEIEDYWQTLYSSRPFIESLYVDGLGARDLQITAWERGPNKAFSRVLSFNPRMSAPRAVKKILGDAFRCEEEGHFDPNAGQWHFVYRSSPLGDKLSISGGQHLSAHPEGCTLHCYLDVAVSIFGVGKLVEKTITTQFKADMEAHARFVRRWVARQT
mgnify:CR=1 FL=1